MEYIVTVQREGILVCSTCFCTDRAVEDGEITIGVVDHTGKTLWAFKTVAMNGRIKHPAKDGHII
jgi:hypothetical protein